MFWWLGLVMLWFVDLMDAGVFDCVILAFVV